MARHSREARQKAGFYASIYNIYEHEVSQKTISENNIGAPKTNRI